MVAEFIFGVSFRKCRLRILEEK